MSAEAENAKSARVGDSVRSPATEDAKMERVREMFDAAGRMPAGELARVLYENDGDIPKANPDAGPGFAHDFGCTHDPCVCLTQGALTATAVPAPRSDSRVSTSLRFPPELHARLTAAAAERGLTFNFLVVAAVREFLDRLLPPEEVRWTSRG